MPHQRRASCLLASRSGGRMLARRDWLDADGALAAWLARLFFVVACRKSVMLPQSGVLPACEFVSVGQRQRVASAFSLGGWYAGSRECAAG